MGDGQHRDGTRLSDGEGGTGIDRHELLFERNLFHRPVVEQIANAAINLNEPAGPVGRSCSDGSVVQPRESGRLAGHEAEPGYAKARIDSQKDPAHLGHLWMPQCRLLLLQSGQYRVGELGVRVDLLNIIELFQPVKKAEHLLSLVIAQIHSGLGNH